MLSTQLVPNNSQLPQDEQGGMAEVEHGEVANLLYVVVWERGLLELYETLRSLHGQTGGCSCGCDVRLIVLCPLNISSWLLSHTASVSNPGPHEGR